MTYYFPFYINRNSKIAEQKRSYNYMGEFKDIINIIEKTIIQMDLIVKNRISRDNFFQYVGHEKMKLFTTRYPLNFEISVNKFEKFISVNIKTWSNQFSFTQDDYSKRRADEFLFRIQNPSDTDNKIGNYPSHKEFQSISAPFSPTYKSDVSKDDLKTLKKRYKNGEITKEEYKRLKKKIC